MHYCGLSCYLAPSFGVPKHRVSFVKALPLECAHAPKLWVSLFNKIKVSVKDENSWWLWKSCWAAWHFQADQCCCLSARVINTLLSHNMALSR